MALSAVVKVTLEAAIKVLMSVTVPVRVSVPLPEPPTVTPPPVIAASVPEGTERVTRTLPAPASTSAIEMPVRAVATSSVTVIETGTAFTGASLSAVMLIVEFADAVSGPPEPVLPPSLIAIVKVSVAGGVSLLITYVRVEPPPPVSRLLSCATVPVRVRVFVPSPPIVTPVAPAAAFSVPDSTDRVTVSTAPSESTSKTVSEALARLKGTCSVAA